MKLIVYEATNLPKYLVPKLRKLTLGPSGSMWDTLMYRELDIAECLEGYTIIVARDAGQVVGWLLAHTYVAVFVRPDRRREGIGTQLLRERLRMDELRLEYLAVDAPGSRFFQKFKGRLRKLEM